MKKEIGFLIFIFGLVLSFSFISAGFDIGDLSNSIQSIYGPSATIKGWVNISLNNEPSNSLFEDGFGNSISLIDLINANSDFEKTCSSENCETDYASENGEALKEVSINKENPALFGLSLSGNEVFSLSGFTIDVSSTNPESEEIPLMIDILNDGKIEWQAYTASNNFGIENFGCFKDLGDTSLGYITQLPYCERITLKETPEVEIGAYVQGSGSVNFDMIIKNSNIGISKTCIASASGSGRISCIPNDFSVDSERDYFVCIKTKNSADNQKYQIAYEKNNPCGFTEPYTGTYVNDFEIFARPKKYSSSISFSLNNAELNNANSYISNVEDYIESYIRTKYDNDCSSVCDIPIKIIGNVNQDVSLSNAELFYSSGGISTSTNQIYDLVETPATISTPENKFQKLFLDKGNFSVPSEFGEYSFTLSLKKEELFSEDISVEEVPEIVSIKPISTAEAYPTEFELNVKSKDDIVKYEWDFGDNDSETTISNVVEHTYEKKGKYSLQVIVTDENQKNSYKTFEINVGSPKEIINNLISEMILNLNNIKLQINDLSSFEKQGIESILRISDLETELGEIQQANATAIAENEADILKDLLKLEIPKSISTSISADAIAFYPEVSNINLDVLRTIGGGSYRASDDEKYRNAVLSWNLENMETAMDFKELSANYKSYDEPILKTFKLNIIKKNQTTNPYLILRNLDDLRFAKDYSEKEESGYIYIELTQPEETITFSTTENIGFIELPLFISPSISELSILEIQTERDEQLLRLAIFVLIIFLLVIIGIVSYIILQEWYKRKYEGYLFKNKNDLYNLVSYVQGSKKKGIGNKEIISRLKKSGWKSEQINYVLKKYSGKRTGMFEIPIGNILDKLRKEKSMQAGKKLGNLPSQNLQSSKKRLFKI